MLPRRFQQKNSTIGSFMCNENKKLLVKNKEKTNMRSCVNETQYYQWLLRRSTNINS